MIYVGESLPSPRGWRADNCLINPSLRVARAFNPGDSTGLNYWPEYASISPAGRRAYVDWLAGGRSDPQADIGLVFLFFYGLERRLFHEGQVADGPMLAAEVERLLGIYGSNGSFRGYASNFLAAAALISGAGPVRIEPGPSTNWQPELPFATLLHLGMVLAEGRPLQADDALLWVLGTPEARLRTSGQRCFAEMRSIFGTRFAELHPQGLAVRTPKGRISASYRAASGGFTVPIRGPHENLPDISDITAPLAGLRDMLEASQADLEAYSRLLGRRPEARGTLEAAMLLPPPLRGEAVAAAAGAVREALTSLLGGFGIAAMSTRALLEALDIQLGTGVKRVPGGIVNQLLQRLDAVGFGIEPDRRYGGEPLTTAADVVVFDAPGGSAVDPERPAYVLAKAAMEVATLAAAADGDVSATEFDALIRDARAMPDLTPAEAIRLEAFVWRLRDRTKTGNALARAANLTVDGRQAIARAAIAAVLADGQASRTEVAFLERLHRTLGLPPEAVHSALHQGAGDAFRAPRPATLPTAAAEGGSSGIALDAARLARIRQETTEVSSLLSGIFAEETEAAPEEAPPAPSPAAASPTRFDGLDGTHGALLEAVLSTPSMPMATFEAEARRLNLFPAGAIETINDWAFERYDDAVLETDDDAVTVADYLRAELQGA